MPAARQITDHPQPTLAVDLALTTVINGALHVLVMRRDDAKQVGGSWALPGGFVRIKDSFEDTLARVLNEKANLKSAYLEQLATFGDLKRDPRGRVISIAYFALAPAERLAAATEGRNGLVLARIETPWEGEKGGPVSVFDGKSKLELAFDHPEIIGTVVKRLRGKLDYSTVGFELLPRRFTLRAAQEIHEAILGRDLTKPAFRRKLLDRKLIRATGKLEAKGGAFRPAELYELVKEK